MKISELQEQLVQSIQDCDTTNFQYMERTTRKQLLIAALDKILTQEDRIRELNDTIEELERRCR